MAATWQRWLRHGAMRCCNQAGRRVLGFCSLVTVVLVLYLISLQTTPNVPRIQTLPDHFSQSLGIRQQQVTKQIFKEDYNGKTQLHHRTNQQGITRSSYSQSSSPDERQNDNTPTIQSRDATYDKNRSVTKSAADVKGKPLEDIRDFQQSEQRADDTNKGQSSQSGTTPIILIVAYLRTGSTFTASLFTQSREAFYVFEPLHMLYDLAKVDRPVLYLNGTARRYGADIADDVITDTLQHWFHCSLSHIDKLSLMDGFHDRYSIHSMKPYVNCVKHKLTRNPSMTYALKECLPETERKCHTANVKIFKTIRTKFEVVEKLMALNPSMKVLHLVRDPRGMFNSQVKNFKKMNISSQVKTMCRRIINDLDISKRIFHNYPENIKHVRYEDLANSPLQAVKELFQFTDMELSNAVKKHVTLSTSSNGRDSCPYCTRRHNSSKTASKWRDSLPPQVLRLINEHCGPLFTRLGYVQFTDMKQIRNHSLATTISGQVDTFLLKDGS